MFLNPFPGFVGANVLKSFFSIKGPQQWKEVIGTQLVVFIPKLAMWQYALRTKCRTTSDRRRHLSFGASLTSLSTFSQIKYFFGGLYGNTKEHVLWRAKLFWASRSTIEPDSYNYFSG